MNITAVMRSLKRVPSTAGRDLRHGVCSAAGLIVLSLERLAPSESESILFP